MFEKQTEQTHFCILTYKTTQTRGVDSVESNPGPLYNDANGHMLQHFAGFIGSWCCFHV